ncbi:MAG: hypothetical protein LAN84_13990 [Acidobacteriia bacterium]|nr:hypothetical protein [Terriglobia bacterium]
MLDFLGNLKRTHYCGDLRAADDARDVVVLGWVARRRDLGNLLFLDLRDRAGIVQVVFNKETQPAAHAKAEQARSEFVVAVEGKVIKRQKANPELATGEVEIIAAKLHILNNAKTPPFPIEDDINASEARRHAPPHGPRSARRARACRYPRLPPGSKYPLRRRARIPRRGYEVRWSSWTT